jgi:hypothetical protein
MMRGWLIAVALTLVQLPAAPAPPQDEISRSGIRAKLYLPDAQHGYYRGTRFDWSGVVASLEWKGHNYFGQWFERYEPTLHDAVTGPAEEFLTNDAGLGYAEAKPGESFVRIGVGAVRKPEEPAYRRFATYDIVDPGIRRLTKGRDWIEFVHELRDTGGYAYIYRKRLRLTDNSLVLEHRLTNTGRKAITTSVYNHDFFMLDAQPTGPDFVVRFAFPPRASRPLGDLAHIQGNEIAYLKPFDRRQTLFTEVEGFGRSASDFDFRVENRKTGAGVRQRGDRPIAKLYFWSAGLTICPEAYIDLQIEPGKDSSWQIAYEFYQLGK